MKTKTAKLMFFLISLPAFASVAVYNSSGVHLGTTNGIRCSTGMTCASSDRQVTLTATPTDFTTGTFTGDLYGDGGDQLYGFLQNQVASTTVAITASQCGSTFVSNSADVMTLPEASTVLGCRLTFVCGTADDFDINPADGTDTILPTGALTPSAGDALRCTDAGAGFALEAVGANSWAVLHTNLTITDVN